MFSDTRKAIRKLPAGAALISKEVAGKLRS